MIAICVGHSRPKNNHPEGGAVSVGNVNEWTFNSGLSGMIHDRLKARGLESYVLNRYEGGGYTTAMRWVATNLKLEGATVAVELHFNSSDDPKSNGHEWLYWHSSVKGKALAESMDRQMKSKVAEIKARGAKPRFRGDRGAEFLTLTHCPAIIAETGFGSNAWDWGVMVAKKEQIADAIASGLADWLG